MHCPFVAANAQLFLVRPERDTIDFRLVTAAAERIDRVARYCIPNAHERSSCRCCRD